MSQISTYSGRSEHTFTVLKKLTKQGIGIVYISIICLKFSRFQINLTLRDGKVISTNSPLILHKKKLAEMISSQSENSELPNQLANIIDVDNLSNSTDFSGITFNIRKGEILGIAGLMGSGRSEIVRTIAGLKQDYAGSIIFKGNL